MEVKSGQEPVVSLYSYQETFIFKEKDPIEVTEAEVALVSKPCLLREEGFGRN